MHDAAAGRHPIDRAGTDRQRSAEAVAMHNLAVEQIGDGGKADMRVRPHVDAVARPEYRRPKVVEEDERPDHARTRRRQRAMHLEAAEIDGARYDQFGDGVARAGVTENWVLSRENAHD